MILLQRLAKLLISIDEGRSDNFVGLGLILFDDLNKLPITNISDNEKELGLPKMQYGDVVQSLLAISDADSVFHDGFHLLNPELNLVGVSKYFSTPIVNEINIRHTYGSRYRTAVYGSCLEGVRYTAVLSNSYGPFIFDNGHEIDPYLII
jgi:hypothetical protein